MKPVYTLASTMLLLLAACDGGRNGGTTGPGREPVASVEVSAPAAEVDSGATLQLTATPRGRGGEPLSGREIAWTSSNDAVATVSPAGLLTAHAAGAAVIRAASEQRTGEVAITVRPTVVPVAAVEITPPGPLTLQVGASQPVSAVARAANGAVLAGRAVTWTSSSEAVAGVTAAGVLEARAAGSAIVTATVEGKAAQLAVTVSAPPPPPARVARVDVDPPAMTAGVGDVVQFRAQPRGENGAPLDRPVAWTSSNEAVATVDSAGRVTARGPGATEITAASEGVAGRAQLVVHAWTARELLSVNGASVPATLYSTTRADGNGAVHTVRYEARSGSIRLLDLVNGRYEQTFMLWVHQEGSPVTGATVVYSGSYQRDPSNGQITFYPAGAALPPFVARIAADGTLTATQRFEPGGAEVTLIYAAP